MFDCLAGEQAALAVIDACETGLGVSLRALARQDFARMEGAGAFANRAAQQLICAFQAAVWAGLCARGLIAPRVFAGYSVGELAAYACAGAIEAVPLTLLARTRADAMNTACPHPNGLVAVRGLARAELERICRSHNAETAIINGSDHLVVGGEAKSLQALTAEATRLGGHATPLPVAVASHTSLMEPARPAFAAALAQIRLKAPLFPVLAGVDGAPVYDAMRAAETLSGQIARPIDWAACMDGVVEMGCGALLELGPGAALSRMFRERWPDIEARSVSEFKTLAGVAAWVERKAGGAVHGR